MAHSRLALTTMFDWIERCLLDGAALPDDAAICERYNFASTESARTLLAELADAGRITIRGYGPTRTITIGRSKPGVVRAERPQPPVQTADASVDRVAARIAEIIARGRRRSPAVTPVKQPEAPPPISREEQAMPASKSITFVATGEVLDKIKELTAGGASNNKAALELVEAGMRVLQKAQQPIPAASTACADLSTEALLDMLRQRLDVPQVDQAAVQAAEARARDADAEAERQRQRAETAETKLAAVRAAFA